MGQTHLVAPNHLLAVGLGLEKGVVHLEVARSRWSTVGNEVAAEIRDLLDGHVAAVEHVGSTSVPGLLAKPILDVAARLDSAGSTDEVRKLLDVAGWEYRGDAGSGGGLVFVLEARPRYRVAHLHVVNEHDDQWGHYLALRDRLRRDPAARVAYGDAKRQLALDHRTDRAAYTDGKDEIVARLRE